MTQKLKKSNGRNYAEFSRKGIDGVFGLRMVQDSGKEILAFRTTKSGIGTRRNTCFGWFGIITCGVGIKRGMFHRKIETTIYTKWQRWN